MKRATLKTAVSLPSLTGPVELGASGRSLSHHRASFFNIQYRWKFQYPHDGPEDSDLRTSSNTASRSDNHNADLTDSEGGYPEHEHGIHNPEPPKRTLKFLLVEDNPADVLLVRIALNEIAPHCSITVAIDGAQAIRLIEAVHQDDRSPFDLILLDLNLPRFDGFEVLKVIRSERMVISPVVMISTTNRKSDQAKALELGANEFSVKPSKLDETFDSIRRLVSKWCRSENVNLG